VKDHKELEVWKSSIELVTEVYAVTRQFPKEELYGLTNQIRRAAVSIPSNISEGAARRTVKEFVHFLHVALGSLSELETQFIIAENLHYLDSAEPILSRVVSIWKMLHGLTRHYQTKADTNE
jgi:four helix bundle protein